MSWQDVNVPQSEISGATDLLTAIRGCYTIDPMRALIIGLIMVLLTGCTTRAGALKVSGDYTMQAVYSESK